ncbi:MAG: SPFH domain-containing protein, partial [Bacteroidota bacterium]
MKRVKIYVHKMGLVFREGNFIKALTEGTHWLWWTDRVIIYDMTHDFVPPCELNILLQDPVLANHLAFLEVKDHELALEYKNGNFQKILTPGRHAFWLSVVDIEHQVLNLNDLDLPAKIDNRLLQHPALLPYLHFFLINAFEKGLLFIDGVLERHLGPGAHYFWKGEKTIVLQKMDLRQQQMEISGQELLTKDKAPLRLNVHAQFKMVDIEKALIETQDFSKQLYLLLQLGLREFVGTLTLDELLARKEDAQNFILDFAKTKMAALGGQLLSCGIRDIILPGEVKTILNQVLIAQKQAQANLIARREETAATRSLLNTAKLMENNAMLYKLKEMEYVEKIAENISNIS